MAKVLDDTVELSDEPTPLPNLGNTCFLNAALQVLWAIFPKLHDETVLIDEATFASDSERPLYKLLTSLFRKRVNEGRDRKRKSANVAEVEETLIKIKLLVSHRFAQFRKDGEQADSHEFLRCLLDVLHEELNQGLGDTVQFKELQGKLKKESDAAAEERWLNWRRARDHSACCVLFHGTQRTVVRCLRCSQRSYNFDLIGGVHLDLMNTTGAAKTGKKREHQSSTSLLTELTDRLVAPEVCIVDGYRCDNCNEGSKQKVLSRVEKSTSISGVPECLIVHLKRFLPDGQTKNVVHVDVPSAIEVGCFTYHLVANCSHIGRDLDSGHYIAAVQRADGPAFLCDDETVSPVDDIRKIEGDAYVLLFQKQI